MVVEVGFRGRSLNTRRRFHGTALFSVACHEKDKDAKTQQERCPQRHRYSDSDLACGVIEAFTRAMPVVAAAAPVTTRTEATTRVTIPVEAPLTAVLVMTFTVFRVEGLLTEIVDGYSVGPIR